MAMEPPFILLKSTSWLPVEETETLLGAIVKNFWTPTDNSVPTEPLVYNKQRKFVEKGYDDFVLTNEGGVGKAAMLKLEGLAKLTWKGVVDDAFDLRGKHICYIKLRQVDKFWEDLKEDPKVQKIVPKWIGSWYRGSKPPVCLITGLFICKDATSKSSKDVSHDREAKLEAPSGTAAVAAGASQGVLLPNDGTGNILRQKPKAIAYLPCSSRSFPPRRSTKQRSDSKTRAPMLQPIVRWVRTKSYLPWTVCILRMLIRRPGKVWRGKIYKVEEPLIQQVVQHPQQAIEHGRVNLSVLMLHLAQAALCIELRSGC